MCRLGGINMKWFKNKAKKQKTPKFKLFEAVRISDNADKQDKAFFNDKIGEIVGFRKDFDDNIVKYTIRFKGDYTASFVEFIADEIDLEKV